LGRFHTQDRFAEKYNDFTPYHYFTNNPILYIDVNGDSLSISGETTAIEKYNEVNTQSMGGYYTTEVDECGNVSIVSTGKEGEMSKQEKAYFGVLSKAVNDKKTTSVEIVESDESVLIGEATSGKIDIDDIQNIGNGNITEGGALLHEVMEQYSIQVNGKSTTEAHRYASGIESSIYGNGCSRDPNSNLTYLKGSYSTKNMGFIEVKVGNSVVYIDVSNNNVVNTVGNGK
jgi:hypothetical protein